MFHWILSMIEGGGYFGIFSLMILENIFPPIPSEFVIPLAGFAAAKGELNIIGVFIAAIMGGLVGCLPWYFLGRFYGIERIKKMSHRFGRVLTLTADDIEYSEAWFNKYGYLAILFGHLVPTVRTLISVPAGIARMSLTTVLFYSLIGMTIWDSVLLFLGYVLENQYEKVASYINVISNVVIVLVVLIYIYRFITYKNIDSKKGAVI